jgi:hypothetical protein
VSDAHIGAFVRLVRQDSLAAARMLKSALSDEDYCALFEALTKVEGWEVHSIETETDDAYSLRYQRKRVTYDRWLPAPTQDAVLFDGTEDDEDRERVLAERALEP